MTLLKKLSSIFSKNPQGELKDITGAINNSLSIASSDLESLKLRYNILSSTGIWLDEWGTWFGIPRLMDEPDNDYANRMIALVSTPKSTIPAIIESARSYLGDPNAVVSVYEPFTNIMTHSKSVFSGPDKYQDGIYWNPGVIDIQIDAQITEVLRNTLQQIKAAGVKVYFTGSFTFGGTAKVIPESEPIIGYDKYISMHSYSHIDSKNIFSTSGSTRSGHRITFSENMREIDFIAITSTLTTADSNIVLSTIWDLTIEQAQYIATDSANPVQVETMPV